MRLTRRCVWVRASSFGKDGDGGAVLYLQEVPSYLVVDDCMGFVECSICGLPGESAAATPLGLFHWKDTTRYTSCSRLRLKSDTRT